MKLEKYILNLLNITDLLNENRIEKLRSQKFPENIINFVIQFSKETTKNPSDEKALEQNQYIPWIASEVKKIPDIMQDKSGLNIVINWIRNANYPKFPSNIPFKNIVEKAESWLHSKNIDPTTGKKIEGGDAIIAYPNGFKWKKIKDLSFCMTAGEARGWCLDQEDRARDFVNIDEGYMLFDNRDVPIMAIQYDFTDKKIIDWQGAFNEMPPLNVALMAADLMGKLKVINFVPGINKDEESFVVSKGNTTFVESVAKYKELAEALSKLKNFQIGTVEKSVLGIPVSEELLLQIPAHIRFINGLPLTQQESKSFHKGVVAIKYADGSRWIKINRKNLEKYSNVFSNTNEDYNNFILFDTKNAPKLLVVYSPSEKELTAWEQQNWKSRDFDDVLKSLDIISKFGKIINIPGLRIRDGKSYVKDDEDSIVSEIKANKTFATRLRRLPNFKLSIIDLFLCGFDLTEKEINSIPIKEKVQYKMPYSEEELNNAPPLVKIAANKKIKSKEINQLPDFAKRIAEVIKGKDPDDTFYDFTTPSSWSVDYDKKGITIDVDGESFREMSGLDEDSYYYLHMGEASESYEEYKYMSYGLLGKENKKLIEELSELLGENPPEDGDEELWDFIADNFENSDAIGRIYERGIDEARFETWRKLEKKGDILKALNAEQTFKSDKNDKIFLPWGKLIKLIADKSVNENLEIESLEDLSDANINKDVDLSLREWYDSVDYDKQEIKYMQNNINSELEKLHSQALENPTGVIQKAKDILRVLGFKKNGLNLKDGMAIEINSIDYKNEKFNITIEKFDKERGLTNKSRGSVDFDNLTNYVNQHNLFENKIRKIVRKTLEEDFRFMYDKQNFTPPTNVVYNVQKALNTVQSNQLVQADGSNEGSGLEKAKALISKEPVNHAQLKRMKAFFDKNANEAAQEKTAGKNITNSAIIQKWELWGGDAGRDWVEKNISSTQSSNKTSKKVRNSDMIARDNRLMDPHNTRTHR